MEIVGTKITTVENDSITVKLEKSHYQREAVFAAGDKFINRAHIRINPVDDEHVSVVFSLKVNGTQTELEYITKEFCNELLDQQVRLDLEKRFGRIRELIVRQAFSPLEDFEVEVDKIAAKC